MSLTDEIRSLITAARSQISAARECLKSDMVLDLNELERLTREIADKAADLPAGTGQPLQKAMMILFEETDRLGAEIQSMRDETQRQLQSMSAGQRAASAYRAKPSGG